jgi:hypothetical protein
MVGAIPLIVEDEAGSLDEVHRRRLRGMVKHIFNMILTD